MFFGCSCHYSPRSASFSVCFRSRPGTRVDILGLRLAKSPIQRVRKDERDG